MSEQDYIRGQRDAIRPILAQLMASLGYDKSDRDKWILEREETISTLRGICEDFGDNEWSPDLYIPDVLDKHLRPQLEELQARVDDMESQREAWHETSIGCHMAKLQSQVSRIPFLEACLDLANATVKKANDLNAKLLVERDRLQSQNAALQSRIRQLESSLAQSDSRGDHS